MVLQMKFKKISDLLPFIIDDIGWTGTMLSAIDLYIALWLLAGNLGFYATTASSREEGILGEF